jgi:hypothetical protein
MQAVKTIGLDIAKSVFQVHGVDAEGRVMSKQRPAKIENNSDPNGARLADGRLRPADYTAGPGAGRGPLCRISSKGVPASRTAMPKSAPNPA